MVQIKRAYEPAKKSDGHRVLVDRIWPRGRTKQELKLDSWIKEVSPSSELRKYFNHDLEKWSEFKKRYQKELRQSSEAKEALSELTELARKKKLTLIYAAKDPEHNNAIVLQNLIQKGVRP